MAHYRGVFEVDAPAERVFNCLADVATWPEWDPSVRSATALHSGPPAAGSQYEVVVGFYGKAIDQLHEILEMETPSRLAIITDGRARGSTVLELTDLGDTTSLVWDANLELKGLARVLDRGLEVAFTGLVENSAQGLQKHFR